MKRCGTCKEDKPLDRFGLRTRNKDGLEGRCKDCRNKSCRNIYSRDREKILLTQRAYQLKNADRIKLRRETYSKDHREELRIHDLLYRHNLTVAEYNILIANGCNICGTHDSLCIDHDHKCCPGKRTCGKCVRGALCAAHNKALGLFNDDVDLLRMAIYYLTGLDRATEIV